MNAAPGPRSAGRRQGCKGAAGDGRCPGDPPAYPLKREWDITYSGKASEPPARVGGFNSIRSFWEVFNNIRPLRVFPVDSTIYCFQRGVAPSWEDPANVGGGRWMYSITDQAAAATAWQQLYLDLVGEGLDPTSDVVGIVCARRRNYTRFSVWTRGTLGLHQREAIITTIGRRLKTGLPPDVKLEYQVHGSDYGAYQFVL